MANSRLIRASSHGLLANVREMMSMPATYVALSTKDILDERDTVPKTRGRIFNPGRENNGGICLYLPTARFHWKEPVTNGEEYEASLDEMRGKYFARSEEIVRYARLTQDFDGAMGKRDEVVKELVLPAFEMGRLSDGITELPIFPGSYFTSLSNGQKLYHLLITYQPFSKRREGIFWSQLEYCQDHSHLRTPDRAAKPFLADVVREMVPQLEPAV